MIYDLINADVVSWARRYAARRKCGEDLLLFHALLCDPPYELKFMGRDWDSTGVSFRAETWRAFKRIMHPGAFGMAFSSARGFHRMAVAIEDAGFRIHPMIGWVYSTGFPKATRIKYNCSCGRKETSKHDLRSVWEANLPQAESIEEAGGQALQPRLQEQSLQLPNKKTVSKQGNEDGKESSLEGGSNLSQPKGKLSQAQNKIREVPNGISDDGEEGQLHNGTQTDNGENGGEVAKEKRSGSSHRSQSRKQQPGKSGVVADQRRTQDGGGGKICARCKKPVIENNPFEGHRYGLQALKPALEPIIVFQKPYEGKPLDSIVGTGAGALNIDAGRIKTDSDIDDKRLGGQGEWKTDKAARNIYEGGYAGENQQSHSAGRWPANFVITHSPDCRVVGTRDDNYEINRFTDGAKPFGHGAGHEFISNPIEGTSIVWECVEGCPALAINEQSGQLKSGKFANHHKITSEWGYHGGERDEIPRSATYGDKGGASRFFYQSEWNLENADPFLYQAKATKKERNAGLGEAQSPHPTVKPITLTRHLANLLLPPDLYAPRNLFIPFAGVASEIIGAYQVGWDNIVGTELQEEYVDIGSARLAHWISQRVAV